MEGMKAMKDQAVLVAAAQKLKQHNIKATPQRQGILAYLMSSSEHPSINMIHQYLLKEDYKVSLATVYNTLELLSAAELVTEVTIDNAGHVRYDYFEEPHYHMICLNCGRIDDIYDDCYLKLEELAAKESGYQVISSHYDVHGICPNCQQKQQNQQKD